MSETGLLDMSEFEAPKKEPVKAPTQGDSSGLLDMSEFETPPRRVLGEPASRMQDAEYGDGETRATRELPEMTFSGLLSNASIKDVAKVAPAILTATDPNEIADILSKNFRYIGITEDEKGNLIANNNETGVQAVINKPGMSPLDVIQMLGIGTSFIPSAQLAGAVKPLTGKIATAMTGAGLTQAGTEGFQESQGGTFDTDEVAIATGTAGVAEVALPAINAIRRTKLQSQVDAAGQEIADVSASVAEAESASESLNMRLFPAQKTQIPADLERQSFLPQLPAGTAKASKELRLQNMEASTAVDKFLSMLAPDTSVITGPKKFRTAAERAIAARKSIRKERSSPLYKAAFDAAESAPPIDLTPVNNLIGDALERYPEGGEVAKSLLRVQRFLKSSGDLRRLHGTKVEIDQMINKTGEGGLGPTTKRELLEVKKALLEQMEKEVGGDVGAGNLYQAARKRFELESPAVNEVESMFGKVSELDDNQLKLISKKIFDATETNPEVVKKAKKIITDIDPTAWDQMMRNEIERRLGSIKTNANPATTENIPNQLYNAIFGNKRQRDVLFNAADGDIRKNLAILESGLGRARLGRVAGSQTAGRTEMNKELEGGMKIAVQDFFETPTASLAAGASAAVTGSTKKASHDARVRALTNVVFDPQWTPRLRDLRKLDSDSPALARAMLQLLDDALKTDIENAQ